MTKKQREGIRRSAIESLEYYEQIIQRIQDLCANFDSKRFIDPGSMALQFRLLFIDSSAHMGGRSVMNLMGVSNAQKILSTMPQQISESTISSMGFLGLRTSAAGSEWYAPLGEGPGARNLLTTDKWLNEAIFKTSSIIFTRFKLISVIANTEGGAHVDPIIDPEYYAIAKANGAGWSFSISEDQLIPLGNLFPAMLRQLCYEVLMTDTRLRNEGWMWQVSNQSRLKSE